MKDIIIYTLIDPRDNQVRYIGKTNNLKQRLANHINRSKSGFNSPIHCWIRKLLDLNLKPTISVQEVCNQDNWEEREKYWIQYYREKYENITNVSDGGITPLKNPDYQKIVHSKKTFKEVHQYDLNGNYINSYNNTSQASKTLGVRRQGIERCLKGEGYSSKGFYWSYIKTNIIKIPQKKPAFSFFKKGHIPNNKGKKASIEVKQKLAIKKMKKVIHIETGEIYNSLMEAAEKNNINYKTLLSQFFYNSKTLKFKYYE